MDIITDRDKAPNNIHYSVTNNSGSVLKKFGKDQKAAYNYAQSMNETAIEASKFHKLNKCDYRFIYCDNSGNEHVIKEVRNAK